MNFKTFKQTWTYEIIEAIGLFIFYMGAICVFAVMAAFFIEFLINAYPVSVGDF